jgi:hypothetical protein
MPLANSTRARPSSAGLSPVSSIALMNSLTASLCGHPQTHEHPDRHLALSA